MKTKTKKLIRYSIQAIAVIALVAIGVWMWKIYCSSFDDDECYEKWEYYINYTDKGTLKKAILCPTTFNADTIYGDDNLCGFVITEKQDTRYCITLRLDSTSEFRSDSVRLLLDGKEKYNCKLLPRSPHKDEMFFFQEDARRLRDRFRKRGKLDVTIQHSKFGEATYHFQHDSLQEPSSVKDAKVNDQRTKK